MKNELLTIGPVTVYGYGLMIAIGIIVACHIGEVRAKRMKMEYERIISITLWCAIGGMLGAKIFYYIVSIKAIIENPKILLDVTDGFVVYGGIIFGIFAGYLYSKKYKLNFFQYFDVVMPSITIAQGFGRIGCILSGCCYGLETDSWFNFTFKDSHYAPNNIALIPTQAISSALNFVHFFILITYAKRKKAEGQVAGLYLILYSAGRFVIEFFRGDIERGNIGRLTTSQFISVFLFVIGLILFIIQGKYGTLVNITETDKIDEADKRKVIKTSKVSANTEEAITKEDEITDEATADMLVDEEIGRDNNNYLDEEIG